MDILLIVGVIVIAIIIFAISVYNSLVVLRNKADEGWADIDTQLKRRWDLIPNMVETVKGYAKHEAGVFEEVTKARSTAMQAESPKERAEAENMLTGTLKSLFAVAENYPDLKANQNFLDLQDTLTEIEEHIQMSRRYYNGTVKDYNTKIQIFPNNLVAGILGFKEREYFKIAEEERKNVKVSFSDKEPEIKSTPAHADIEKEEKEPTEHKKPTEEETSSEEIAAPSKEESEKEQ